MAKGKLSIFLCMLVMAMGFGSTSPRAADDQTNDCFDTPYDAVMRLPAPLRKWGRIDCTPYGHALASRDGWIWMSLENGKKVALPSQLTGGNPRKVGNDSYFTSIHVSELQEEEFAPALAMFNDGLSFEEPTAKAYRVDLISVSEDIFTLFFFDFGAFGGAMACPNDECIAESRFLIMEQENKPRPPSV